MVVDINIGMDRTGVTPGRRPCWSSPGAIDRADGLRFAGIMGYEGHVLTPGRTRRTGPGDRRPMAGLLRVAPAHRGGRHPGRDRQWRRLGQPLFAAAHPGLTELQAGGACFMDPFYGEDCHLEELASSTR